MNKYLILATVFLLWACNKQVDTSPHVNVNIDINGFDNEKILVFQWQGNNLAFIDSTKVANNKANFKIFAENLSFFAVTDSKNSFWIHFFAKNSDTIFIKINKENLPRYQISGNSPSELVNEIERKTDSVNRILKKLIEQRADTASFIEQTRMNFKVFAEKIINSPAVVVLLSKKFITNSPILPISNYSYLYQSAIEHLQEYKSCYFYQQFRNFYEKNKPQTPQKIQITNLSLNIQNYKIDLGKPKRKVLLVFCASWQKDIEKTIEFANSVDKILVLKFFLDSDESYLNHEQKKGYFWVLDDFWNNYLIKHYNINKIPTYVALKPDGSVAIKTNEIRVINNFLKTF